MLRDTHCAELVIRYFGVYIPPPMKKKKRIVVCDPSRLGSNLYEMILKPCGASLFLFDSLGAFRKVWETSVRVDAFLIHLRGVDQKKKDLEWLLAEPKLQKAALVFLSPEKEENFSFDLPVGRRFQTLCLPVYPSALCEAVL